MKKTILIAISLLAATYLGTILWFDAAVTWQEELGTYFEKETNQ